MRHARPQSPEGGGPRRRAGPEARRARPQSLPSGGGLGALHEAQDALEAAGARAEPAAARTDVQAELQNLTQELAREVQRHRSALALLRGSAKSEATWRTSAATTASTAGSNASSASSLAMLAPTSSFATVIGDADIASSRPAPLDRAKSETGAGLSRRLSAPPASLRMAGSRARAEEASAVRDVEDLDFAAEEHLPRSKGAGGSGYKKETPTPSATASPAVSPADSSSRVCLSEADGNQSFFLHAVFDLVKSKLEWEMQVLESLRIKYPELPASNEAIMYGHLRKGKGLNVRSKFVLISPGLMTYLTSSAAPGIQEGAPSSSASPLVLFGKNSKDKKEPVKTLRLRPGTRCRPIEKKHGRFAFEIIDAGASLDSIAPARLYGASVVDGNEVRSSETRVWAVSSEDERVRWMRVIEDAAGLESRIESEPFVEEKALNDHYAKLAKSRVAEAYLETLGKVFGLAHLSAAQLICVLHDGDDSEGALTVDEDDDNDAETGSLSGSSNSDKRSLPTQGGDVGSVVEADVIDAPVRGSKRVNVPVAWVHDKLHLPRGGISNDSTMMQILKDMQRDTIVINGKHFEGHSEFVGKRSAGSSGSFASPAVCSIVCEIAREIQRHSLEVELTEAEALELAHQVLMTCNRTQSGGNTLDAVSVLCANPDFSFVAADTSVPTQPLQIRVYNAPRLRRCAPESGHKSPRSGDGGGSSGGRPISYRRGARRHRASSQPQFEGGKIKPEKGSPNRHDISAPMHRKTSSDGDFSAALANLDADDEAEAGHGSAPGANDTQESRSSSTTPSKSSHAHPEFRLSLSKLRHRRRASEPLQLDVPLTALADAAAQQEHQQRLEASSVTEDELDPAPRVDICVVMHYKLCNVNFQDESDAVWARVRANFRRTFALVGQRKTVALGQGTISLSLLRRNPH